MAWRSRSGAIAGAIAAAALLLVPDVAPAQYRGHHGGGWDRGDGPGYRGRGGGGGDGYRDDDRDRDRGGYRGGSGDGRRGPRGGRDRRFRCRDNGTGGTIIGAIAGGLLGNSIAGYGDRAAGTILGAGGGALAGRAIDRDC